MAEIPVGPKAIGTGAGLVAAVNYAPDATTVTLSYLHFAVDPTKFAEAVQSLVNGGWIATLGAVGLLGGLIAGWVWRRAEARFGNGHAAPPVTE